MPMSRQRPALSIAAASGARAVFAQQCEVASAQNF
jgi:hypothetical protein